MNSNAQATKFANQRIRVMADLLGTSYMSAKKLLLEWQSQNLAAVIPNDATIVDDGAGVDGRPLMANQQALAIVSLCQQLTNWLETGQLASGGVVNNVDIAIIGSVAVNSQSKF